MCSGNKGASLFDAYLKTRKTLMRNKKQYSGTVGRIENCQIGVFLTYANSKGFSDRQRTSYAARMAGFDVLSSRSFDTKLIQQHNLSILILALLSI